MGWNPLWAWVCSVSDPQDAIKELMNCILRAVGEENGGLMDLVAATIQILRSLEAFALP